MADGWHMLFMLLVRYEGLGYISDRQEGECTDGCAAGVQVYNGGNKRKITKRWLGIVVL